MQFRHKTSTESSSQPTEAAERPYNIGVALSGGGSRGIAHAGALMALEQAGIKPDVIAGVSAGSVVAVLYASGMHPLDIVRLFDSTGFTDFTRPTRGGGFFTIDPFKRFIMKAIEPIKNIEDLHIPTYICATDLDNGVPVAFDRGAIGERMAASCSVPIIFKPVKIEGINYVDGGVLRNHPAWVLRDKCRTLIGVNVSPLAAGKTKNAVIDVALRTYHLMAKANQRNDMDLCDISIETPEIASHAPFSLTKINKLFMSGFMHTRQKLIDAGLWQPQADSLDSIKNLIRKK